MEEKSSELRAAIEQASADVTDKAQLFLTSGRNT